MGIDLEKFGRKVVLASDLPSEIVARVEKIDASKDKHGRDIIRVWVEVLEPEEYTGQRAVICWNNVYCRYVASFLKKKLGTTRADEMIGRVFKFVRTTIDDIDPETAKRLKERGLTMPHPRHVPIEVLEESEEEEEEEETEEEEEEEEESELTESEVDKLVEQAKKKLRRKR